MILDNHYRTVRTVQSGGGMAGSDMHEFKPIGDGKTAVMTVYQQRQFDMSTWNIKTGMGWIMESIFQEVDVETSEELFEWRSLDHVDPSETFTWPDHTDTSGNGLDTHSPWDYFHINSIDKNKDGDYLISSRHTCAIYKISGKDGSVMWRLHGTNPTFRNINFSFSQQHDARWLYENSTHTVLSLFNNGYNGFNQTHAYSSGMIVMIDHENLTATMTAEFSPYLNNVLASSQGSTQILSNGHVVTGWGNTAYVSEHDEYGKLIFWALIGNGETMNYRAQKFEWEGYPTDNPAMWTYSRTEEEDSPMTFYVSWNGATQVKSWKFYGAWNQSDSYELLAEIGKRGFETTYTHAGFYPWTYAEAIDKDGNVLGSSSDKFTFVPSPVLREYCADQLCENTLEYGLPDEEDSKPLVPPAGIKTVPWVDNEDSDADADGIPRPVTAPQGHQPSNSNNGGTDTQKQCTFTRGLSFCLLFFNQSNTITGQIAWGIALLAVVIIATVILNCAYFRRSRRYDGQFNRLKESRSSENLEAAGKHQPSSPSSPWWDVRGWMRNEKPMSPRYYSLANQSRENYTDE